LRKRRRAFMKKIEVLGMGCARCNDLDERVRQAVRESGVEAEVVKVKDIQTIAGYGVLATPALVVDGVVKTAGKIPTLDQIKEWIKQE
jgi:small redox-active disulfide protein 2